MSYQLKVKSNEAGPWGSTESRYVSFHINGSGNWELANSYIEFQGEVNMTTYVTYADGYTGVLTFGYRDATNEYDYKSGPAVFVKHCWLEGSRLGKIESKRYANLINEHLADLQKSSNVVESQNYSGGSKVQVVDNLFTVRLQLSDLLELAKDMPLVDLEYMGDCVLTLELEVANSLSQFLKYDSTGSAVPCVDIAGAAASTTILTSTIPRREHTGLHLNQVYTIVWTGSISGVQTSQHIITDIDEVLGSCFITISPGMVSANPGEDLEDILIQRIIMAPPDTGVDFITLNTVDLVMYKPYGMVKMDKMAFREMLVDTDNQPASANFHKQWFIEPNVEWCIFLNPNDNEFVNLHQDMERYRNQINGYDTVDRDVYKNSGLYYDRVIMNVPNLKSLDVISNICHISERMPLNGQMNNLNLNVYYDSAPTARTAYLFKHQQKVM